MATRLLCCVDGSAHAARAIEVAAEIAAGLDCEIALLAVNRTSPASGFPPIRAWSEDELKAIFADAARKVRESGARNPKRIVVEARDVADAIVTCAADQGFNHIIVGTGDASLAGRLLLGSVSEAVAARARCTVTIAR